ncbi:unnamed protein product [Cylindrotheca closterium]|uniref:Uncharacterized protein n=1 Tax=Cylindrotheca closterium TaxID=2856 RepID=A0AAD2FXF7_9STRA|nr:unnamed protein product [Cylindrotheca closterium]
MDFQTFLLECCHPDDEYNQDYMNAEEDDDFPEDEHDLSLERAEQSTVASEIYATPERLNKRQQQQQQQQQQSSPELMARSPDCNPNILSTLGKSTSSTPIRYRDSHDRNGERNHGNSNNSNLKTREQQEYQHKLHKKPLSSSKPATTASVSASVTPATAMTAAVSPFLDDSILDGESSLPLNVEGETDDIFAEASTPQRNFFQQQRMHLNRVLSFSSAAFDNNSKTDNTATAVTTTTTASAAVTTTLGAEDSFNIEQKVKLPTPSSSMDNNDNDGDDDALSMQTPIILQQDYTNKPLVPPSAVAGARRRMPMVPVGATLPQEEQEEEISTMDVAGHQQQQQQQQHQDQKRSSIVSALVAKMNAATGTAAAASSSHFTGTTASTTMFFNNTVVHENSREDDNDEWSQGEDSLLNMTDDDQSETQDQQQQVEESFSDLQQGRKQDAFELFPNHENMFCKPNEANAPTIVKPDEIGTDTDTKDAVVAGTVLTTTPKEDSKILIRPIETSSTVHITPIIPQVDEETDLMEVVEKIIDEKIVNDNVVDGDDDGSDFGDDGFEDENADISLPIIFHDEFGDLPDGEIFDDEDFGLQQQQEQQQQQQYGVYHEEYQEESTPPPTYEEEMQAEKKKALLLSSKTKTKNNKNGNKKQSKTTNADKSTATSRKKKNRVGKSLKMKFASLLLQKKNKDDYGSLKNEDSFEKQKQKQTPKDNQTLSSSRSATAVPTKKKEVSLPAPVLAKPAEANPIAIPTIRTATTSSSSMIPPLAMSKSEDSFVTTTNDPWSTETTQAAFPAVKTEPTKLKAAAPASPIKLCKHDTPPIHSPPPSPSHNNAVETAAAAEDDSWQQLLVGETNTKEPIDTTKEAPLMDDPWMAMIQDLDGGTKKKSRDGAENASSRNEDPWMMMIQDLDTFENVTITPTSDALPIQFSGDDFFSSSKVEFSSPQQEQADQEGPHVIPLDTEELMATQESPSSSPTIDTSTVQRPSQMAPKRRITGVTNTKAIFETAASSSSFKRPSQVKRTSSANLVSPDKEELPQDASAAKEKNAGRSVQDLTDAFDTERTPKMVNRKVRAWEHPSGKTEPAATPRQSRVSIRVVSGGDKKSERTSRSASLPKRVSSGRGRNSNVNVDKELSVPKHVDNDWEKGTSVQDLTDAFDTERTPKMVNRKVKAFERERTSEKPEPATRRNPNPRVAIHVVRGGDNARSSSLTKRVSSGGEVERSHVRSSSLTKRVPPKSSPSLPKKAAQPVNPIEVPRKELDNVETTTRRSSNVGQMANIFDPRKVSKDNVNKIAGAFQKETKVFQKPKPIPANKTRGDKPFVKRSFSSNAIPAKTPIAAPFPKRASVAAPVNVAGKTFSGESSESKKLFSYWEQVAVTTKSTPMPTGTAEENVVVVDEGSNKELAVDSSFDFSDPDSESGVPTVDERAWVKTSNQSETATFFSL